MPRTRGDDALRERYAAVVREAVDRDYTDAANVRHDADLAPRARAEFRTLVAELDKKFPLPTAPQPHELRR